MKRRTTIVTGVLWTPAHPLKCVTLITVHRAPVTQIVKQTAQLFRKRYTEDVTTVQQLIRVADSLMCIEHIINQVWHWDETDQRSKRSAIT
jgi:hypothetical protein